MNLNTLKLTVAVPDHQVLDAEVTSVQFPLTTGYIGILPGHAPLLAEVGTGVLTYDVAGRPDQHLAIDGGAVEVLPDSCLLYTSPSPRDGLLSRMPSSA